MKQNLIDSAKAQIRDIILSSLGRLAVKEAVPSEPLPAFTVERTNDVSHGDFAANTALVCAKAFKLPPRKIAELIIEEAVLEGTYFEKVEAAGPGFLNFFLSKGWFGEVIETVIDSGKDYGKTDFGAGKSVLVEFVSANPTGPMHIGNARGGALGDCLAEVLSWAGYRVEREFYVNDSGNQINKFALSLEVRYLQIYKGEENVEMPEDAYHGEDIRVHARNFAEAYGDKYVECDTEERRKALVDFALPLNIAKLKEDLEKYRINYDTWFLESELHNSGAVDEIIEKFKNSGYTYTQDDALWFKSTEFGEDQDRVLVRSNGVPTYFVPDVAYHYNKLVTRNFDIAIDILGADHHGYIPRMQAAMKALGINCDRLKIIIMQMVRLVKDGETYKLSKRSGKAITLNDLLEEVPVDAARFFFNLREPNTHLDFDLDLAIEKSSQNPVYYVEYAHARICSILSNLAEEGIVPNKLSSADMEVLDTSEERALISHLAAFPCEISSSAAELDPSRLTRYCMETATLFHKFYTACRVKGSEDNIMQARLSLCVASKICLKNLLDILKIEAPEKM